MYSLLLCERCIHTGEPSWMTWDSYCSFEAADDGLADVCMRGVAFIHARIVRIDPLLRVFR